MNDIIGRHGGGGHHGGHHGGGGHHGHGGRRYFGGGWGGGYDAGPWYDYDDDVLEIVPVQILRRPPADALVLSGKSGELADLGAVLAPGVHGLSVKFDIGGDRVLHATICIDGHCYEGCADLAPILDMQAQDPEAAVQIAGDILVGALIDDHTATISAGWWSGIKKATYGVHHGVAKVVQKFKVPITIAATAVATVYGGPAGGAAAAKFTGPLVDGMADDFKSLRGAQAKQTIANAEQQAKDDPAIAKALGNAKKAVAQAAAGYVLKDTAEKAEAGDENAKKKLAELDAAASAGDPGAQKAAEAIAVTAAAKEENKASSWTDVLKDGLTSAISNYAGKNKKNDTAKDDAAMAENAFRNDAKLKVSGAVNDAALFAAARRQGSNSVLRAYAKRRSNALGFVYLMTGQWSALPFASLDDADDWFGGLEPGTYLYAAYYDPHGALWPHAENEDTWRSRARRTNVSGLPILPFLLGTGAGIAGTVGWYGYQRNRAMHAAAAAMPPVASNAPGSAPSTQTPPPSVASGALAPNDPIFVQVPVVDEDGNVTDEIVKWPTSQTAKHFGRAPDFYLDPLLDSHGGDLFLWMPAGWSAELGGNAVHQWKPTWHARKYQPRHPVRSGFPWIPLAGAGVAAALTIPTLAYSMGEPVHSGAGVPSWVDPNEAALMRAWYPFAKRYRHLDRPFVIMEHGSSQALRFVNSRPKLQDAMLVAAQMAGDFPAESTVYVFDARQPNGRPLSGVPGYSYALRDVG